MSSNNNGKESRFKGKHAHSTEYRRLIWEMIVWPLIIEKNRPYFSIDEYQSKRVLFSKESNIPSSKVSGGLISLVVKGILIKEEHIYSLHYRLIPYLRKKAILTYGQALKETYTK
ncbi:MAG TPA: hypothetical protein VF222_04270 [Nitrososphaeraceae archaeon]